MNLFTWNSPYYRLLKYLLFLLKHPVYVLKIFWWWGSIKSTLAGSLFKWFKYTDLQRPAVYPDDRNGVYLQNTGVFEPLVAVVKPKFYWNRYCPSLLKSVFPVTSEIDIVCRFCNGYCLSLLKSIFFITSEISIVCHFWNRYCLSLLKSILLVTSEIDILSLLKSILSITSEINIFYHFWNQYYLSLLQVAQHGAVGNKRTWQDLIYHKMV
jgi:hypothetical protein